MSTPQIVPFEIACDKPASTKSGEVSKRLELGTIVLADGAIRLHMPISKLLGASMSLEMGFESGFSFEESKKTFSCVVKTHAKGIIDSAPNNQIKKGADAFTVLASYMLESTLAEDFNSEEERNEHFQAFSSINAPMMVWPMWREFLQSATGRMGLSPITAPFLKVNIK